MESLRWEDRRLLILDQTKLPEAIEYISCNHYWEVVKAIKNLSVRGAPAIGAAAAYGLVLGVQNLETEEFNKFYSEAEKIAGILSSSRPTAVNLSWALERMLSKLHLSQQREPVQLVDLMLREAEAIYREDLEGNRSIGHYGLGLIPDGARILTHCNAGSLATAGYGTALGVVRAAWEAGKGVSVYAGETRPLLQGARLTTMELMQANIPVTLITDNMAGYLMSSGKVDLVIVGADRIAANGDAANKIGTYGLAVLAREHGLPFYVAAPFSTVDMKLRTGLDIPIEERNPEEVTCFAGIRVAPEGVKVWNPAFDVTPAQLITAIITERGLASPPYGQALKKLFCQ